MFTGIIEAVGSIRGVAEVPGGRTLHVDAGALGSESRPGASIAVNGVCLTVRQVQGTVVTLDVIAETLRRTNLGSLQPGGHVNLERSVAVGDRLDGHFVQGHVDGRGVIWRREETSREFVLFIRPDAMLLPYIPAKGSIAVDGVSLTIAALQGDVFGVALIPTTLQRTTLGDRRAGDTVNLETDMLVRALVHYLQKSPGSLGPASNLSPTHYL